MSIDNHAAWLGEAHFCHFCDFCGTLKKMCGICVRGTTYLREIKVDFARVYPFFRSFSAFPVMKIVYGNNKRYP